MDEIELMQRLGVALAIGLLIGFERGWHSREAPEGTRIAGIRTFALSGLLGGVWALLGDQLGPVATGAGFLAFAALMIAARLRAAKELGDHGTTTVVAVMLTFGLGALAARGEIEVAGAAAVVATILLGIKPGLHEWLRHIERVELFAVLKLAAMTVVLLPVLPNQGYGPWDAINPFELWLMVVLISSISFAGYVAIRLAGETRGVLLAALAGGMVSSTAVTLSFSRMARDNDAEARLFSAGILLATATMLPRVLVVAWALSPAVGRFMLIPLGAATLGAVAISALVWRENARTRARAGVELKNPFEFMAALQFGVLLTVIAVLSRALQEWLGDTGLYLLGAVSGLADVDAINLTLARMAGAGSAPETVAAGAILLAVLSNTIVKVGLAYAGGGRRLAFRVGYGVAAITACGAVGTAVAFMTI